MYEAFYGLTERPFNLTPDPRFLYLSEKHKEAFAHLLYGIKNQSGFVMLSGEVGTGKTTICRSLLNQLDPDTEVAFIFNPFLSPEELLRKIIEEFGIRSMGATTKDLIDELNTYLLHAAAEGKNCVLVIDEAQNLSPSVLEQIRLLSNLETETQKLLQIVLIGQPELAQCLALPELRQLNQRITARYHLKELSFDETLQYIAFRLRVAGGRKKVAFTRGAVKAVYRFSKGTPRIINAICDRALLVGYTQEVREISVGIIRQAAREIRGEKIKRSRRLGRFVQRFMPSPTIVATAVLVMILVKWFAGSSYPTVPPNMPERDRASGVPAGLLDASDLMAELPTLPTTGERADQPFERRVAEAKRDDRREAVTPPEKADASFEETLTALTPDAARRASVSAIMRVWNMAFVGDYPSDNSLAALGHFAEQAGFAHEALTCSLDQLLTVDLPALALMAVHGRYKWVAVLGAKEGDLEVACGSGEPFTASKADFAQYYAEQAFFFWRDSAPNGRVLAEGMQGAEVRELQQALIGLARLPGDASGVFDRATAHAVEQLQRETGIKVDGKAGRQVRMVLSSWRRDPAQPSLAHVVSKGPAAPAEEAAAQEKSPAEGPETEPEEASALPEAEVEAASADQPGEQPLPAKEDEGQEAPGKPESAEEQEVVQVPEVRTPLAGQEIVVQDLPSQPEASHLPPLENGPPKEVTPPAVDSVPLVPHDVSLRSSGTGALPDHDGFGRTSRDS